MQKKIKNQIKHGQLLYQTKVRRNQSEIVISIFNNLIIEGFYENIYQRYTSIYFDFNQKYKSFHNKKSISFQKSQICFEFFQEKQFILIRDILRKRINQIGFQDQFKLISKIGKGTFAQVYLAIKTEDNTKFAVKILKKQQIYKNKNGKQAIQNQINILRRLQNRNIVQLFQVFESDDQIFLVMEYLPGGSLQQNIKKNGKIRGDDIIKIMGNILSGLLYLHSKNIMHRDLKLENILLKKTDNFNDCSICDFGLSADREEQYIYYRCGTAGYTAPQILLTNNSSNKYSTICDIFSAGVIFYQLLFNQKLFVGKCQKQILQRNKNCEIDYRNQRYRKIPIQAFHLLTKMLEPNPNLRITAYQALQHDYFDEFIESLNIGKLTNNLQFNHSQNSDRRKQKIKQKNLLENNFEIRKISKYREEYQKIDCSRG